MKKIFKGFTIVELIVVMAIIGVLILIAVPTLNKYMKDAMVVDRNALAKVAYTAAVAYSVEAQITESVNPTSADLKPYITDDVKIVSGLGEENCNGWGHYEWDNDNSADKDEKMCVHIILKGGKYDNAGLTSATEYNWVIVEMYDPNIDQEYEGSEKNIKYYKYKF